MNKVLFFSSLLCFFLFSCGGNKEELPFNKSAEAFCSCMSEKIPENKAEVIKNVNIGLCALEVDVDYKDQRFSDALENKCPEIAASFEEYIKN